MSKTQHSHRDHSPGCHVTAGVALRDDTLASDDGCSGLAVKQIQPSVTVARADLDLIGAGEKYYILDSGEADIELPAAISAAVKGDRIWIDPATNAVSINNGAPVAGREKLGKIRYIGPERGLPVGFATISFDARKDF